MEPIYRFEVMGNGLAALDSSTSTLPNKGSSSSGSRHNPNTNTVQGGLPQSTRGKQNNHNDTETIHALVRARRGKVRAEGRVPGTPLWCLTADVPVMESVGLEDGGAA